MVLKVVISAPAYHSDYVQLIKKCLKKLGHETSNYIAARLKYFRESTSEERNFKIKIIQDYRVILIFKVSGGHGSIFRTKYKIDELDIKRYD